ncbi:hypothetical protein MCOR25_007698 [Pyricularia grisea]|nr:hypothetical protein MCOR25_007698 [Pyricularia grisea]
MIDNRLEIHLARPIPKKKSTENQKRQWVKELLKLNVPHNSSPVHFEHLLNHIGPPPTVLSFVPQPTFDIPGLAVGDKRGQKAKHLATPLPNQIYSPHVTHSARLLGMKLPHFFTLDQVRKVIDALLDTCDMWTRAGEKSWSMTPRKSEELTEFLRELNHFTRSMQKVMDEADATSLPLVTDLAAKSRLQPMDTNPAFFGGTLMLWPIMDLKDDLQLPSGASFASEQGLHDLLAQATIRTIKKCFNRDAYIKPGETGVWLNDKTLSVPRRIATIRPILGPDLITSFGVGLQVGPLPKEANKVDQTMTSLAELGDMPSTAASLAKHWMEEFAGLLAENAGIAAKKFSPQMKKAARKAMERSRIEKGPAWTVDHLEDAALGWRAQSPFDPSWERHLTEGPKLVADSSLYSMACLFDQASSKVLWLERNVNLKKDPSQVNEVLDIMEIASEVAQGRPWLGVDKIMDTWRSRPINMTTMSELDLHMLDHRAVIPGNESFPKIKPIPAKELITESELIWPDLTVSKVDRIFPKPTYDPELVAPYKHYCAWVLRILRESSCGRHLDARLTDHSVRYVTGEMLAQSAVTLAVLKGASSSIATSIKYGLNYMQCAALYRRALTTPQEQPDDNAFPSRLSHLEARLVFPQNRILARRGEKLLNPVKAFSSGYFGGLLPPEDFDETLKRLERFPGDRAFSKKAMRVIKGRYGKNVLRATGLQKAPPNWRVIEDFLGRF